MSIQSTKCNRELLDDPRRLQNDLKPCSLTHLDDLPNEYFIVCVWTVRAVTIKVTLNRTFRFFSVSSRCGVARSSRSGVTISTLINTGCGLSVVSLLTGLSVSQTSEAILLYALRYHTIGFDRFFWLWSFPHAVFVYTNSLCIIRCLHSEIVHGHPYKLPVLWTPNSPDLNPSYYKIWCIIHQRVQSTKVQDVKDLMQRLIDAWAGVESVIQDVIANGTGVSITAFSHKKIFWMFTVTKN